MPKHSPGKQALFDLYASRNTSPNKAAMQVGIEEGYLFDPPVVDLEHDAVIAQAKLALENADQTSIANAFVSSLSSRALSLRPALGSFAFLKHLPSHAFEPSTNERICAVCGTARTQRLNRNLANWHRYAQGSAGQSCVATAAFDLEQAAKWGPLAAPTSEDRDLLRVLLEDLRRCEGKSAVSSAVKALSSVLKSNRVERVRLVEVLAMAGVLLPKDFPSSLCEWVTVYSECAFPMSNGDWGFPAIYWQGGVRDDAVEVWFSKFLEAAKH